MVRYSRKELNEKFSDKQDAEIQRLLAKERFLTIS
jgi:hypothetical protein